MNKKRKIISPRSDILNKLRIPDIIRHIIIKYDYFVQGIPSLILEGHDKEVSCLTYINNDLIVSSAHNYIKIWNLESGICLKTIHHNTIISCLLIVDNLILIGSQNKNIRIWNFITEKDEGVLKGHTLGITCLKSLEDGRIVSGSKDNNLKVWNLTTKECEVTFSDHQMAIKSILVLTNNRIASMSFHYDLKVWNSNTGELISQLMNPISYLYSYFSYFEHGRHHKMLLGLSGYNLLLTDADEIYVTLKGHRGIITCNEVLLDNRIITGSHDKTLRIWNPDNGDCDIILTDHKYAVKRILVLPNGNIISSDTFGKIILWK